MIHATAIIDPAAELDDNVSVGPYSVIGAGVRIGAGSRIGAHVVINGPTFIGRDNQIFQFASIGDAPQDLKYDGEPTELHIGDRNRIREYVTMNRGTVGGGGKTSVGNDNLVMAYCHIAHDCHVGNHVIFSNAASLAGHVEIADHVILGGFTNVHQFVRVGRYAFSGMASAISQDVAPFVLVNGNHANARGINKVGLKRAGFDSASVNALQKVFRLVLKTRGDLQGALAEAETLAQEFSEVREFVEFVRTSERGCTR